MILGLVLALAVPARAATITEFDANPGAFSFPLSIASGPEGNLWWAEAGAEPGIGRMSTSGERLPLIHDSNIPIDVVVAPSGWASWVSEGGIGSRSPTGLVTVTESLLRGGAIALTPGNQLRWGGGESVSATVVCRPEPDGDHFVAERNCFGEKNGHLVTGLAASPAGVLWASIEGSDRVLQFGPPFSLAGSIELPAGSGPVGIAIGPEGSAWVAMWNASAVDRLTPSGMRTRFLLPAGSQPEDIALGPDGAFWITESGTGKIGRMTTAGVLTGEYPVPSGMTGQVGITVGPDNALWFTDPEAGKIGRLVPDPPPPPLVVPPPDTVAPRFLGSPLFSPRRFAVKGQAKARASRVAKKSVGGSTLKFTLSEAGKVTATVAKPAPGRRAGKKCVAPGKAKPSAAKCTRYVNKGTLSLNGKQGSNMAPFSGKLKGKALPPGPYRAILIARDGAGNASQPRTAAFTIVP